MKIAVLRFFQPSKNSVVWPDDARVGYGANGQVHNVVLKNQLVRLMVALTRQICDNGPKRTAIRNNRDGPRVDNVNLPVVKSHRCDRQLVAKCATRNQCGPLTTGFNPRNFRLTAAT